MFETLQAEIAISHALQAGATSSLDSFFLVITWLGHPFVWMFLVAFFYWKGDEKKSFFLAVTILFASAVVGILKPILARARPSEELFRVIVHEIDSPFGLPSGHAATISSIFGYYWEKFEHAAKFTGLAIVVIVLISRIYLGAHFIGDVILGAFIGFLIGRLVHELEAKFKNIKINNKKMLEEVGIAGSIIFAIIISALFRPLGLATGLLGYFAGVFAYKYFGFDNKKILGKELWVKAIFGFLGLGLLMYGAELTLLGPELYFAGGIWISFVYPLAYDTTASLLKYSKLKK